MSDETLAEMYTEHDKPFGTGWANEPKLKTLKQDLSGSQPTHDSQIAKIDDWADYRKGKGKAAPKAQSKQSKVVPKLIMKQAEWRYASLSEPFLSTPDLFKVSPVTWEDKPGAVQNELLLNNQFTAQMDRTAFIDAYVRAAVDDGTVVLRVGWDFQEEEVDVPLPVYEQYLDPNMMQVYQQMLQLEQSSPVMLNSFSREVQDGFQAFKQTGLPYRFVVTGMRTEKQMQTKVNKPTVEVCDIRNIYIDPSCMGDIDKASFVIYSFDTSLAELKAEGDKYKNLSKIRVSADTPLTAEYHSTENLNNFQPAGDVRKRIVAYEYWGYWDINNDGLVKPVVVTWVGDVIIRMEENPFPNGFLPFVTVAYRPVSKSCFGEPDAELLKDNQDILGAIMRGTIDLLGKSANSQTGFAKNMLDATNKKRYEGGQDYEFNPGTQPQAGIYTHVYPDVPASAQYMIAMQNNEAESMTGVKAFATTGINGASLGDTATSVRGALDAASKREMGILRRLSAGLIKVARKVIAMNSVFMDEEQTIRITEEEFVPIRRDDLAGEYDLKLTISTAEADEAQAQELAFMLQTIGNNMDPGMTKMILAEIARLRKMPDLAHQIKAYEPQPDPMAQKMQEMQMQLLQEQINLTHAQAMEAATKAGINQVKSGTEQARTEHIQSQTDKNNLDFLNEQSGVKHEQQKELQDMKDNTALTSQAMKDNATVEQRKLQHQSDLLKLHASTDLNHRSTLQQMRAEKDLNPSESTGA